MPSLSTQHPARLLDDADRLKEGCSDAKAADGERGGPDARLVFGLDRGETWPFVLEGDVAPGVRAKAGRSCVDGK